MQSKNVNSLTETKSNILISNKTHCEPCGKKYEAAQNQCAKMQNQLVETQY